MDKFEASNGATVERFSESLDVETGSVESWLSPWAVDALREFFQAERDEELGRWRWPENPDYVVYPSDERGTSGRRRVRVVEERTGRSETVVQGYGGEFQNPARAFFEAHRERKPWHDAKPGEVWVLTLMGDEIAYQCTSSLAGHVYFDGVNDTIELNSTMITAARRIWPEVSDD